ncbi:ammonium transporter [Crateriforma conspicua]|uniref:Ammonium transporter n=2 Tax=Crateriforma conspicua TaxID=2527996 RepID=A0A5C5Y7J5_9PLAN|nr:ammonium transporter [Crateriforma conspicua]QDV65361.1 Ammonia channel precursor [Crateriforma conspicua]TWT70753.1 Ammonia channel precursor [Crateriforma conspicua]
MRNMFGANWLVIALLVGMLGVGAPLATVASAQEDAASVMEADAADAGGDADSAPAGWNAGDEVSALSYDDANDYTINTLIMFVCAVLVLFMQAGFAMVEVGMNSAKNTVNILAKNVMDLSVGVLLYLFIGYSLMYPGSWIADGYLGSPSAFISRDAQVEEVDGAEVWAAAPTYSDGAYASNSADFLFQVAFAATAATIVSGSVAGRMKFSAYLIYSAILTGLIYPISGAWKWGGGFLDAMGFQDFAGSVVVHAVGGFAGLAGAIFLGPRLGRYSADGKSIPIPGHNIAFAALGVFILWIGWYGFNPGSQLTYSGAMNAEATTYIALTTTIAASAGAVLAMILGWALFGKPDLTMALNGVLGGLVAITANCDRVGQFEALVIGGIGGALVVLGIVLLDKLKIDDPVGAWPVHGLCGVWGGIATGVFGDIPADDMTRGGFITVQVIATVVICVWAFVTMSVVFGVLKAIGMLRVSPEEEQAGLDISEHGMHAYPSDAVAGGAIA